MKPIFTPTEWEIIEHRLDVDCAIAEALCDEEESPYNEDEVSMKAYNMRIAGNVVTDWNSLSQLEKDILFDCVDGSTFLCDIDDAVFIGELSKGRMLAYKKAANNLFEKMHTLTGNYPISMARG